MKFTEWCRDMERGTREDLRGVLTVDQIYAHYQEVGLDLRHPEGGVALALTTSILDQHPTYLRKLADAVLDGREAMVRAMTGCMEDLNLMYYDRAPRDFNDLRASGQPSVFEGDDEVYHRPANVHRLSEQELRDKKELKAMGF